jgi:glutamate synthase (NADPH/NADH) large chain
VVLGEIGRNFAAGMSGGVAYVLDADPALVNHEMVELEPATGDEEVLRRLVQRHDEETESVVAAALLEAWPDAVDRFTRSCRRTSNAC